MFAELTVGELLLLLEARSKRARMDKLGSHFGAQTLNAEWHYDKMNEILVEIKNRIIEAREKYVLDEKNKKK